MLNFNRNVGRIVYLERSMLRHGYIGAYPLHCVENGNGKLKIKDGQHRFVVAKSLGLAVKYVVCHDTATVYELQETLNKWKLEDYLVSWIRAGKKAYLTVKEYHTRTGINLGACISMLAGDSASASNHQNRIKDGTYQLGDPVHAAVVSDIVLHIKRVGIEWGAIDLLVQAISKVVWAEGFNPSVLKKRISSHRQMMQKQPSKKEYVALLDTIYNFGSKDRDRIPLAFLADKAARERCAVKQVA
jgi:hypothetical protein